MSVFEATEGAPLLLLTGEGRSTYAVATSDVHKRVKLDKGPQRSLATFLGTTYGSCFAPSAAKGDLVLTSPMSAAEESAVEQQRLGAGSVADNRGLVDDNTSQAISAEQIEEMRASGVSGDDVVRKIVEGSSTFASKTAFAQEKYIRRKKNKHKVVVTSVFPNAVNISEAAYRRDPTKVCNLRPDSLGRVLHKAGIVEGGRAMVFESCGGLVTASVAERVGPSSGGQVVHVLSSATGSNAAPAHAAHFRRPLAEIRNVPIGSMVAATWKDATFLTVDASLNVEPVDSLVVVSKFAPVDAVMALIPYLAPSGMLVVFSVALRPLEELAGVIAGILVCDVELTETWTRDYQVLPQRTHPNMEMNGSSGFILSAIKVSTGPREIASALANYRRLRSVAIPPAPAVIQTPAPALAPPATVADVTQQGEVATTVPVPTAEGEPDAKKPRKDVGDMTQ